MTRALPHDVRCSEKDDNADRNGEGEEMGRISRIVMSLLLRGRGGYEIAQQRRNSERCSVEHPAFRIYNIPLTATMVNLT